MTGLQWYIKPIHSLKDYAEEWDIINKSYDNLEILSYDFFSTAVKDLTNKNLLVAICSNDSRVICITIVEKVGFGVSRTFQPSQSPIGAWIQYPEICTRKLIISLSKKLHVLALGFSITQQDPKIGNINITTDTRDIEKLPYILTGSLSSNQNFTTFWESRGKNLRQNTNKSINRLKKENDILTLRTIMNSSDISKAIDIYGQLESSGWKSNTNTAISSDNQQGQFYKNFFEILASKNSAIIYQLVLGDRVIASDLTVVSKNKIIILKTTYDENYKRFSPASVLRKMQFEQIFNIPSIDEIEFYGKMMDWHYRWTQDTREMYHINWLSPAGRLAKKVRAFIK